MPRLFAILLLLSACVPTWADDEDDDAWARQETIRRALAEKIREAPRPANVTPAEIAKRLPVRTALIDLLEYESLSRKEGRQLMALIYRPKKALERVELGPIAPMEEALARYLPSLSGEPDAAAGKALQKLLWKPLAKYLAGADRIFVAPDGFAWGVPWSALPAEKAGSYLIEDHSFEVVRSAAHLLETPAKASTGVPLLVGGLDHGEGKVKPLDSGARDVAAIAAMYRKSHDESANVIDRLDRMGMLSRLGGKEKPSLVHLAAPAFFGPPVKDRLGRSRAGLAMGLLLTGANKDPKKGIVTVVDATSLDLRGCGLVVLTGPGGGRAVYSRGEGGLGLALAFGMAGARAVIGAAWDPGGPATAELMRGFYGRLWGKGLAPWQALREAQLDMLKAPKGRTHPGRWAAWVLSHQGG